MNVREIQIEPRNVTWLALVDEPLSQLTVRTQLRTYCQLSDPSPQLAAAALWEAVVAYSREWAGSPPEAVPPLQVIAWAKPL